MKHCYTKRLSEVRLAIVDLTMYEDGAIINRINVPHSFRGQGIGSELLKNVLNDADKDSIPLYLEIHASDGLDRDQLKAWYTRNGFKEIDNNFYKREPKWK